jgi:phage regulator Rha-like protein
MSRANKVVSPRDVSRLILVLRGGNVLLDTDLAELYGVETRVLNQAVRRNQARFPADFLLKATRAEWQLLRSQFVTLESGRGRHRKYPPLAFTEYGAIMVANVLNSDRAIEMAIHVVRAFVEVRHELAVNADLARKLAELESSMSHLDARMRRKFNEVYDAIKALIAPRPAASRPIGFTAKVE